MRGFLGSAIGRYMPGKTPLHQADPRLKLILLLAFMTTVFALSSWSGFLALFILILLAILISKVPPGWIFKALRPLLYIILFTLIVHFFFTPGKVMARIGPFTVSEEGFRAGLFLSARFILLIISAFVLTFTTSPIELTDALESLFSFLKPLKVPVHELAMMMTIAIRFIPNLAIEAERIMKAQIARGADFESGGLIKRSKSLISLLIPLFIAVFKQADEVALAMEARCYRGGEGRTRMKPIKMRPSDWAAAAVIPTLLLAIFITWGV